MANFKDGSRYTNGTFTLDANKDKFLLLRSQLQISFSELDQYITVTSDLINRPDLIAYEAYGRPELGWVIMDINNIRQPLLDLTVGQELRIPPLDLVLDAIETLNKEE